MPAIMTALYDRDRSGEGRLVEVAMQETVYSSLAASFEYYHRTGETAAARRQPAGRAVERAVQRLSGGRRAWVAIHVVTEGHWKNLMKAMGREELGDDPRFAPTPTASRNMDETDAVVGEWTRTLPKMEVFARRKARPRARARRCAPRPRSCTIRTCTSAACWSEIDHPELGPIIVPTSPLRLQGCGSAPAAPSPTIGQHNDGDLWRLARPVGRRSWRN